MVSVDVIRVIVADKDDMFFCCNLDRYIVEHLCMEVVDSTGKNFIYLTICMESNKIQVNLKRQLFCQICKSNL